MKSSKYILSLLLLLFLCSFRQDKSVSALQLSNRMFAATKKVKTMTYSMLKKERIDGKLTSQESWVKMSINPFKIYIKMGSEKKPREVLYPAEAGSKSALVNPGSFPWVNVKLDPYGETIRKDQHHTIFEAGFDHVVSILEFLFKKYESSMSELIHYQGTTVFKGVKCHRVYFDNPNYKYIKYTVGKNENLMDIAARLHLSEYMILKKNPSLSGYEDVKEGQVITIPNDYAPKMTVLIDAARMIPLSMLVYDEQGLFEQYDYYDVVVNPVFAADEFSAENSAYGF